MSEFINLFALLITTLTRLQDSLQQMGREAFQADPALNGEFVRLTGTQFNEYHRLYMETMDRRLTPEEISAMMVMDDEVTRRRDGILNQYHGHVANDWD